MTVDKLKIPILKMLNSFGKLFLLGYDFNVIDDNQQFIANALGRHPAYRSPNNRFAKLVANSFRTTSSSAVDISD